MTIFVGYTFTMKYIVHKIKDLDLYRLLNGFHATYKIEFISQKIIVFKFL